MVSTEAILDGVAQWCLAYDLDTGVVTEAHFQKPSLQFPLGQDAKHSAGFSNGEIVEGDSLMG